MKSLQNLLSTREVKEAQSGAMTTNSSHESEKYFLDIWDISVMSKVMKSLSSFYWAMIDEANNKVAMLNVRQIMLFKRDLLVAM